MPNKNENEHSLKKTDSEMLFMPNKCYYCHEESIENLHHLIAQLVFHACIFVSIGAF